MNSLLKFYRIGVLFFLGLAITFPSLAQKNSYTISGYITDDKTGENLIGVNIYELASLKGVTSNTYGFYSLTLPKDSVEIAFSYVGYQTIIKKIYLDKNQSINITLKDDIILEEVTIEAEESRLEQVQMSKVDLEVQEIKKIPALMGEVDVLKALQLLPGVQSGGEGSSGLYVRGGSPDQNLILLDGVPVYNASHLFGFFSVFNADALNKIELIKGGHPARYGGRLSSVLDITMKEGNKDHITAQGSVGIISANVTVDGPIKNENTTFLLSGRRTYIDALAAPFLRNSETKAGYYFYDFNAKVNHRFSDKDRVFVSGYFGKDRGSIKNNEGDSESQFGLDWGNQTVAARWNHMFNPKLFSNLTTTYSKYQFNIRIESKEEDSSQKAIYLSSIEDYAMKIDFDYFPNPQHSIKFGGMMTRHHFRPGALSFTDTSINENIGIGKSRFATESFIYVEDDWEITDRLKSNIGLHGSTYFVEEENYFSFQPRMALRYLLPKNFAIKASYSKMQQYIHLLANASVGLPTDLWVSSNKKAPPQISNQVAVGISKNMKNNFEISVEGYFKTMKNVIAYKEGSNFLDPSEPWEDKVDVGDGESYGIETFIQKRKGKHSGWLGYTLSYTNRQFDNVNNGEPFPFTYDRRHDINFVYQYDLSKRWEFSLNWVYGTGRAITLANANYASLPSNTDLGFEEFNPGLKNYDSRNGFRMPSYHRMDISFTYKKMKRFGEKQWVFSVYNAYNRRNPYFIDVSTQNGESTYIQYSLFPILPSISYRFNFK